MMIMTTWLEQSYAYDCKCFQWLYNCAIGDGGDDDKSEVEDLHHSDADNEREDDILPQ